MDLALLEAFYHACETRSVATGEARTAVDSFIDKVLDAALAVPAPGDNAVLMRP